MANKDITDFLLTEYENIAKAFFNSYDIGARWVRYYLIILAVPFSFIAFIYYNKADQFDLFNLPASIAILICVIGLLNILVSYIIVDLKLDSILYARTVNGIRKYFVEKILHVEELGANKIQEYVLLPTDINKPAFLRFGSGDLFFLTSFMVIINSIYSSLARSLHPSTTMTYTQAFIRSIFFMGDTLGASDNYSTGIIEKWG